MKRATKKKPVNRATVDIANAFVVARQNGVRLMLQSAIGAAAAELGEELTKKELRAFLRNGKVWSQIREMLKLAKRVVARDS